MYVFSGLYYFYRQAESPDSPLTHVSLRSGLDLNENHIGHKTFDERREKRRLLNMHFANISTFGPLQHDMYGSNWSLQRHGSHTHLASLLGLAHHDISDEIIIGPEDSRFERDVDLIPDKTTGDYRHKCTSGSCQRIYINVSGQFYETQLGTLNRYPNTLMGNPIKRRKYWDPDQRCYFFARHAPSFANILYYYQSGGRLYCPEDIPDDVFLDEVKFYELGAEVIDDFKLRNGYIPERQIYLPYEHWKRKLWLLLEHPNSSLAARATGIISILMILLSIVNFCWETIPSYENELCINDTTSGKVNEFGQWEWKEKQNFQSPFNIIECICVAWFTIELVLRFISCPFKLKFLKNMMNIFDFCAVVPFYIITIVVLLTGTCDHTKHSGISIVFLRVLRLFRAFRIFKLTKHSRGMQILGLTIKQSLKELSLFAIFLLITMVFFSAAIYYADLFDTRSENIASIPDGFWYSIITMCTVG